MRLIIIDTGCANLNSVKFACERLGLSPIVSDKADEILGADKLILPGVGTAEFAMTALNDKNLADVVRQVTVPLLGICLGMQLLTDYSVESDSGKIATLGLIPSHTQKLVVGQLPLPHIGWNTIHFERSHPLFDGVADGSFVYYVHSYGVPVGECTLASSEYGQAFSAILQKDNFYGMQFHPEKSGKVGARLLKNFIENI